MANFAILNVVVVTFLFVSASANRFNPFYYMTPYLSDGSKAAYEEVVFGKDVEGAETLASTQTTYLLPPDEPEKHIYLPYPFSSHSDNANITKISVFIGKTDDSDSTTVNIKEGGVGENHVLLEFVVKNSTKLNYKVHIYGTKS